MTFETALRAAVLICGAYLALLWLMHWGLLAVGIVETRRRRREREVDDIDALSDSRFAPGVSILVPAYNESAGLPDAVRSLLAIEYPEFEVIVVNDGSTDDTLERLVDELDLVPVDASSRDVVETEQVIGYYRSPSDRRLLVVDKLNGGKADGLNAGAQPQPIPVRLRRRRGHGLRPRLARARDARDRARPGGGRADELLREHARPRRVAAGRRPLRRARHPPAVRLPVLRLPPRVLRHEDRVGAAQLHAVRRGRVPDLAARPRRGPQRLVADVHVRGHRVHVPRAPGPAPARTIRTASRACRTASASPRGRTRCGSSSPSASAGSA